LDRRLGRGQGPQSDAQARALNSSKFSTQFGEILQMDRDRMMLRRIEAQGREGNLREQIHRGSVPQGYPLFLHHLYTLRRWCNLLIIKHQLFVRNAVVSLSVRECYDAAVHSFIFPGSDIARLPLAGKFHSIFDQHTLGETNLRRLDGGG
jgi:hypothetical protein